MTHHLHTVFSDGVDRPEDLVNAALARGWGQIGFSDHAPVEGESWCMKAQDLDRYFITLRDLKARFLERIEVLIGLELDWSETMGMAPDPRLEYWIGSLHFFEESGQRFAIDGNLAMVTDTLRTVFGGDGRLFAARYYRSLAEMVQTSRPPVLGHLDLLKKQNPVLKLFDPDAAWYRALVGEVLDAVASAGTVIEVNTGGMARGYTTEPYPSWEILGQVRQRGLPIQLNSDAHQIGTLDFAYAPVGKELRERGFASQRVLSGSGWKDMAW